MSPGILPPPARGLFAPSATKKQETRNKMLAAGRLFIRKSALSAIFCCGFGAAKYYDI